MKIPRAVCSRLGFTMIELMVVLAISVTISIASFVAFSNVSSSKSVKNTLDEMEALTTAARKKSISQETGARWGVRVENTDSSKRIVMFSGISYASGTPSNFYSMKRNVVLTNPVASTTYDAIFDPITGFLSEKKVFTVATLKKDGIIGDLIVNTIGAVTQRYDYGLVGYWHFDEGMGTTTYDASGIGNIGTLTNSPTWQTSANCKAGVCLDFNGTTNYVSVGNKNEHTLSTRGSVSIWIYIPSTWGGSTYPNVVSKGASAGWDTDGWSLYVFNPNSDGRIGVGQRSGTSVANISFLNTLKDEWVHIVGTWDGSQIKIYENGVLKGTTTQSFSLPVTTTSLFIGKDQNSQYFDGKIDEVRIYNRALSVTEILAMYNDLK
ncbi:MAG: LamG-like jellyroll fold domain-containing protein [Candidatus Paceibacterota bacterium]